MINHIKLEDPLDDYNWSSLYRNYDDKTKPKHHLLVSCLKYIDIEPQPKNDRDLYRIILKNIEANNGALTFDIYASIHCWKMYSVSQETNKRLREEPYLRKNAMKGIERFNQINQRNRLCSKDIKKIANLISWLNNNDDLHGVRNSVGSAICHFIYPDLVPIVDKMVFMAVGNNEKNSKAALTDIDSIKSYIEYNWDLAERHATNFSERFYESSIRLIDMSLWEIRDSGGLTKPSSGRAKGARR